MSDITVLPATESWIKIQTDPGIQREIFDHFSFRVPNYFHMPAFKMGIWDGYIRLFQKGKMYYGLCEQLVKFAEQKQYSIDAGNILMHKEYSIVQAQKFFSTLNIPEKYQSRDYQLQSFAYCVRANRALFLSPTASGKTLMIYLLARYFNNKTLIIVDTIGQYKQMISNFRSFGFDVDNNIDVLPETKKRYSDKPIIITTWQSIYRAPSAWFKQFKTCIADEAHKCKAKSLVTIMTELTECKHRFGFTGSLDGSQTSEIVLTGLFGPIKQLTTSKELREQKYLSDLMIKIITLHYDQHITNIASIDSYQQQYEFLINNTSRNNFIKNLALSLEGNTLVLFRRVEDHGEKIYKLIEQANDQKIPLYFIAGKTDEQERELIRQVVDTHEHSILVGSEKTTATAIDIPSLRNVILASPGKAPVNVLQSIGRGLRRTETKTFCEIFDIADDISSYGIKHRNERIKIYKQHQYPYKIYDVKLDQ